MVKLKHKIVLKNITENHRSVSRAMIEAGYSKHTASKPSNLTKTKSWQELMQQYLPDDLLAQKHFELLNSTNIDHLVFPLGPKGQDDDNFSGGKVDKSKKKDAIRVERTSLTDKEIIEMLADVNCKVRRIVHGETARHVYFWSADNKARKDGLDMAYKMKSRYQDEDKTKIDPFAALKAVYMIAEKIVEKQNKEKKIIELQ
jgi:hypothetical protein